MVSSKIKEKYLIAKEIFDEAISLEENSYKINKDFLYDKVSSLDNFETRQILYYAIKQNSSSTNQILNVFSGNFPFEETYLKQKDFPSFDECVKNAFNWDNLQCSPNDKFWRQTICGNLDGYFRPFGLKLRISATSVEEANIIWNEIHPFLEKHFGEFDFKVPFSIEKFEELNKDDNPQKGKFITIYTHSDEQAFELAHELVNIFDNKDIFKPFLPGTDIAIGNSGKVSFAADMDERGSYINHISDDRSSRRDIYNIAKRKILNENLIYGISEELNKEKDESYHFSNRFYDVLPIELKSYFNNLLEKDYFSEKVIDFFNKYNIDTSEIGSIVGKNIEYLVEEEPFNYLISMGVPKRDILLTSFQELDSENLNYLFQYNHSINTDDIKFLVKEFYGKEDFQDKINNMIDSFLLENRRNKKDIEKLNSLQDYLIFTDDDIKEKYINNINKFGLINEIKSGDLIDLTIDEVKGLIKNNNVENSEIVDILEKQILKETSKENKKVFSI